MQKLLLLLLGLIGLFYLAGCNQRLAVKVTSDDAMNEEYLENKWIKERKNIGVVFSGGGNRSAAATIGELRALNKIHLLDSVKYISCVSGGAWTSIAYTYLDSSISDRVFYGEYVNPEDLTMAKLRFLERRSMARSISRGYLWYRVLYNGLTLKGDETFASCLNNIYLHRLKIGDRKKYFSYNNETVNEICNRSINKANGLQPKDFYTVNQKSNRPYLIVNGTFIGGIKNSKGFPQLSLEMSPLYTGISYHNSSVKSPVGGGFTEPFGFDSKWESYNNKDNKIAIVKRGIKRYQFTLSDMMAITGNAPGTVFTRDGDFFGNHLGLPEFRLWSPAQHYSNKYDSLNTKEFSFGDGGNLENLGIIPLLKRKVDKLIIFVNSKQNIHKNEKGEIVIDEAISRVFGEFNNYTKIERNKIAAHVLSNELNELTRLKDSLFSLRLNKKALIYTDNYKVIPNLLYGVDTTNKWSQVQITWVYIDSVNAANYIDNVVGNEKIKKKYNKGKFSPKKTIFPHLPTFNTSYSFRGIDYRKKWTNLLAHYSSWMVYDNRDKFLQVINE